ncbi:MAG: hypothetical protein U0835_00190 [Isosphaeraceae bacterium]
MKKTAILLFLELLPFAAAAQVSYTGTAPAAGDQACFQNTLGQVTSCGNVGTGSVNNVVKSGAFASKPSPTLGALYLATDLGNYGCLLVATASQWHPASGACTIYQNMVADTLHTGDTTETNMRAVPLPAALLSVNGTFRLTALGAATGTNNTKTYKCYFSSTSGANSGALFLNNAISASSLSGTFVKTFTNRNSASSQVGGSATNAGTGSSSAADATGTLNTANASYINCSATLANSADAAGYDGLIVEWLE